MFVETAVLVLLTPLSNDNVEPVLNALAIYISLIKTVQR
jgi:hypothetical protein